MIIKGLPEVWYVETSNRGTGRHIYSPQLYIKLLPLSTPYPLSSRGVIEKVLNIKQ